MVAIKLSKIVGENRRLIIDVPADMPVGEVEVIIRSTSEAVVTRELARAKLLTAGMLTTSIPVPADAKPLTIEERQRIGTLSAGARPSEALIDEDRGAW